MCRLPAVTLLASIGAFASILTAAFIHGELLSVAKVMMQYFFLLPTYVNMFSIYSFCNMHDISWGTKEGELAFCSELNHHRDAVFVQCCMHLPRSS
jgi:cellulose synthase/poly-beta-1,6-N-acetylglucosamine synthase-like glycosyltransferase